MLAIDVIILFLWRSRKFLCLLFWIEGCRATSAVSHILVGGLSEMSDRVQEYWPTEKLSYYWHLQYTFSKELFFSRQFSLERTLNMKFWQRRLLLMETLYKTTDSKSEFLFKFTLWVCSSLVLEEAPLWVEQGNLFWFWNVETAFCSWASKWHWYHWLLQLQTLC